MAYNGKSLTQLMPHPWHITATTHLPLLIRPLPVLCAAILNNPLDSLAHKAAATGHEDDVVGGHFRAASNWCNLKRPKECKKVKGQAFLTCHKFRVASSSDVFTSLLSSSHIHSSSSSSYTHSKPTITTLTLITHTTLCQNNHSLNLIRQPRMPLYSVDRSTCTWVPIKHALNEMHQDSSDHDRFL